jgi:quercetin dioxygenase-like cupin family protein
MTDHSPDGNAAHPEGGSCDLPEPSTLQTDLAHRRFDQTTFSWEGITAQVYKRGDAGTAGLGWRNVVRHTLAGGDALAFQLRYFEIASAGYSSLEKHAHAHTIVVLRGRGKVVAGRGVFTVEPFDLVVIPPQFPHQFVNTGAEPFGFLCLVDAERDAPQAVPANELEALLSEPDVRAAVRIADPVGGPAGAGRQGA